MSNSEAAAGKATSPLLIKYWRGNSSPARLLSSTTPDYFYFDVLIHN